MKPTLSMNTHTTPFLQGWHPVIGADVWARLQGDKVARVPASDIYPDCFKDGPLCAWQSEMHARGFVTIKLENSALGWSLRYASGLDGFCLLASVRTGELDGSYEQAFAVATSWQAEAPTKRSVIQYFD